MESAALLSQPLPKLGVIVTALAAAGVLCGRDPRRRGIWMALALIFSAAVLVGHIHDTDQFRSVSGSPAKVVLMILVGGAALAALAYLFYSRPDVLPVVAIAVLPFRVPIAAAGATVNLLVPLYLVIGAGTLAYIWRHRAGDQRDPMLARPSRLEIALALFVVLYALQALYSRDFDTALEQTVFFLIPFAVLFQLLREVRWTRRLVGICLAVLVVEALVFSAIGFWEYDRRELFWNPKVIASNQFDSFFRVNSVFWDPNIYGRFLALVIVLLSGFMLWSNRVKIALWSAVVLAILWGGLVLTFSQSSFVALLAGLVVLAALRWDLRRTLAVAGAGLALALVTVFAFQSTLNIELDSSSGIDKFSSGRGSLISGGASLFADRPLWGYGSGSFGRAYRQEQNGNQQESVSASHTLPITVAAEQGLVGLAAYLAVLYFAFAALFGNAAQRAALAGRDPPPTDPALIGARAAVAAAFVVLVVHTMTYAAFLEDPFSWVLMAAGLSLAPLAVIAPQRTHEPTSVASPAST